jgi:hypothetical protein
VRLGESQVVTLVDVHGSHNGQTLDVAASASTGLARNHVLINCSQIFVSACLLK